MVIVEITDKMKQTAAKWERIVKSRLQYDINYTGISSPRRFYWGYLGEFAFAQVLKDNKKVAMYNVRLDGRGDAEDFLIFLATGRSIKVDVKTISPDAYHNDKLLVNQKQYKTSPENLYVCVKLMESKALVYGYSHVKDMLFKDDGFTKKKEPTYFMPLTSLGSIEHLLKVMQEGELKTTIQ